MDEFERTRQPSSRLDIEAVWRARMLSLKKSRAGYLGNLNKLYKDVELLMRNAENYQEACGKKENVDIAFARCLLAYDEFYQFVVDDPVLKSEAFDAWHSVMTGKKEFDERFEEWSQSAQRIADEASAGLRQEDYVNEEVPNVTPSLVGSKGEIEKAKVVDDLYETSEHSKHTTKEEFKPLKQEKNTEKSRQTFPSVKQPPTVPPDESSLKHGDNKQVERSSTKSALNPNLQSWDPGPPPQNIGGGSLTSSQSLQQILKQQQEALHLMAFSIQQEQGYVKAQEILHHRFGQKHIVAHAHIAKIAEGPQLKNTDVTGLTDLSVQMQNCALTLVQMGYEADVNSSENLVKIVKRLPVHLQSKWADRAGTLTLAGIDPTFTHLAGFVEEKALLANTMYGRIVSSTPDKERSSKPPSKVKPPSSKGRTFATQSEVVAGCVQVGATPALAICPLCSGQHRLSKCELMKAKTPEERKSLVRQARLCDNCFQSGHMAMNCGSKMKCQVSGCGWNTTQCCMSERRMKITTLLVITLQSPYNRLDPLPLVKPVRLERVPSMGPVRLEQVPPVRAERLERVPRRERERPAQYNYDERATRPGSDVTLCDVRLMEKLQVVGLPKEFSLVTVNGASETRMGYELSLSVRGLRMDEEIELNRVWTVDTLRLPQGSPPTKEDAAQWPHLNGIDFPVIQNDKVSLLIGCDVPEAHWVCDQRRGRRVPLSGGP
ncbi:hypothetical protein ACROYT_G028600 [Oculina patagonica]